MANRPSSEASPGGLLLRALLPLAILAGGAIGFWSLASQNTKPERPEAKKSTLKTRVEALTRVDYPVVIKTHAIVQHHNLVTLMPEVAGVVTAVSPSFQVGSYFSEGESLIEIDARDYKTALSIAESRLASARSSLKLARLTEERKLRLIESNAVSKAEVDAASATREQAEADVELAATEVEQAQLNLERTKVIAPFDGRVQSKQVGVGQMTGPNTALGEVFAVDYSEVRLPISAEQRRFLRLPEMADDPPIDVALHDALDEANGVVWNARVVRTEGVLDQDSRDLFAIARIDDPFGRKSGAPPLRVGQPVVAYLQGETLHNVIALPRSALRRLDEVVLVNQADQTLLSLDVKPIWTDQQHVLVPASSIPENTWLSTTRLKYTPEGSKVEIIPETECSEAIADTKKCDPKQGVAN